MAFAPRPTAAPSPGRRGRGRRGPDAEPPDGRAAEPDADPSGVARQICLQQLEARPRTRAELAAVLAKRNVDAEVADEVLSRFTEVGIIDDAAFADLWVTSRHRDKGLAGRALRQELRRKGVDDEHIADAVGGLDPDVELATARTLVDRRLASTRGLPAEARVRRLAGMLARKGYPAGTAFRVVREALADEGQELEVSFEALTSLDTET